MTRGSSTADLRMAAIPVTSGRALSQFGRFNKIRWPAAGRSAALAIVERTSHRHLRSSEHDGAAAENIGRARSALDCEARRPIVITSSTSSSSAFRSRSRGKLHGAWLPIFVRYYLFSQYAMPPANNPQPYPAPKITGGYVPTSFIQYSGSRMPYTRSGRFASWV